MLSYSRRHNGLSNLGNTCYANAVLQVLCYTPRLYYYLTDLAIYIRKLSHIRSLLKNTAVCDESSQIELPNTCALIDCVQRVMKFLRDSDKTGHSVNPSTVLTLIRSINRVFTAGEEHDSQELLLCLLDSVQQSVRDIETFRLALLTVLSQLQSKLGSEVLVDTCSTHATTTSIDEYLSKACRGSPSGESHFVGVEPGSPPSLAQFCKSSSSVDVKDTTDNAPMLSPIFSTSIVDGLESSKNQSNFTFANHDSMKTSCADVHKNSFSNSPDDSWKKVRGGAKTSPVGKLPFGGVYQSNVAFQTERKRAFNDTSGRAKELETLNKKSRFVESLSDENDCLGENTLQFSLSQLHQYVQFMTLDMDNSRFGGEFVLDQMTGQVRCSTQCCECETETLKRQEFGVISCSVFVKKEEQSDQEPLTETEQFNDSAISVQSDSIPWPQSAFYDEETLSGNDKFYCNRCQELQEARIVQVYDQLPHLLFFHLKRFTLTEFGLSKVTDPVNIPLQFSHATSNGSLDRYKLYAIVIHDGSNISCGHYTSVVNVNNDDLSGNWFVFDDDYVFSLSHSELMEITEPASSSTRTPYLVFYVRMTTDDAAL